MTSTTRGTPLSRSEHARIDRALRRLHEAMQAFLLAWPVAQRSPSALSRELEVDRTTCQRLSTISSNPYDASMMLESMPGPRALRTLIDAARPLSSGDVVDALSAAVDAFDEALHECAGSVSQLRRRISAAPALSEPSDDADARESLYLAAAHLTGRSAVATASVGLYDAVDVEDGELRHVRVTTNHGLRSRPDAVPMLLEAFDGSGAAQEDRWQRTPALIPGLTNAEWRPVKLPQTASFTGRAVEVACSERPSDVFMYTAFPVPEPASLTPAIEESWFLLNCPSRSLVFDIYLHESVARRCVVSLDLHLWRANFANDPHGHWHTRMPQSLGVDALGRTDASRTGLHARHAELTADLFERADADRCEYVGFRCAQVHPIWRVGYRFLLDFASLGA